MAGLEVGIQRRREDARTTPKDHPDHARRLNNLGNQLGKQYSRTGVLADLEEAIQYGREAVHATPEDHPNRARRLSNLGTQLGKRYSRTGMLADLEEAIQLGREALSLIPEDHPDRVRLLNNLGNRLGDQYSRTGILADLEEAIQLGREALYITPEDHPDRAMYLNNLGSGLGDQYSRTGVLANLEEAIQLGREALHATPGDHPDHVLYLNNLGKVLGDRYSRIGVLADLEEAIQIGRETLRATPEDHPDRDMYLYNLGSGLGDRYLRTGVLADLDEAIQLGREALHITPEDHPDRPRHLNNLGTGIGDRYLRTGILADLDEAIQLGREALYIIPEDHPNRAMYLNNLGCGLGDRYSRTGVLADLDEAIQIGREAVRATPEYHPDRAMYLNNLGCGLGDRYSRTGVLANLDDAIQVGREAVRATPEDHPDHAMYTYNLGIRLGQRYSRTGVLDNLEEAIQFGREAVHATPEDHPNHAKYLNNLGKELGDRYLRTGVLADLEEAIQYGREAVRATPGDHPDRAMYLNNLGSALKDRYSGLGTLANLEEAILHAKSALQQETSFITTRIRAGENAIHYISLLRNWQDCYEVAETTVRLVPRLTLRSLRNSDKQHLLGEVVGLASNAAAAALNAQKGALAALTLLELGRGVLAESLEELRVDITDLRHTYPLMAERFVQLRAMLDKPIPRSLSKNRLYNTSWQAQARERADAEKELDKLLISIQKKPGFNDFLQAPNDKKMQHAAQKGPIVTINISQLRCDAIIVEQDKIHVLPLPSLSSREIEEKAKCDDLGSPRVLEWLWDCIMCPILEKLRFTQSPSDSNWPHVWWIPTGSLTKFPLHAAGYHDQGDTKTVLDRVMSSYSSSVKAIIHGRKHSAKQPSSAHALLVAMEHTPGSGHLPFAAKEVEILHDRCKAIGLCPIQPKRHKRDIISHLAECKIFHFAGHGYTDHVDPSKSQLILEDGQEGSLTVADLLEINIREHSPFLAYLSACGTGQIRDERFIDESIHLISAFQLAGFRHVIGTLWSVNDETCVDMARITYEVMADGQMNDEVVSRGLHQAAKEMRDRWLQASLEFRCQLKPARNAPNHQESDETNSVNVDGTTRLPRDIQPIETDVDGDKSRTQALWAPYVHFGV
ncbi:CHAT domain-containing protein [Aspergillus filifer]